MITEDRIRRAVWIAALRLRAREIERGVFAFLDRGGALRIASAKAMGRCGMQLRGDGGTTAHELITSRPASQQEQRSFYRLRGDDDDERGHEH